MKIKLNICWRNDGEKREVVEGKFDGEFKSWNDLEQFVTYLKKNYSYKEKIQEV